MNAASPEPPAWSPARRWSLILLVFLAHIGLIALFTDRKPPVRRPPAPAPVLELATVYDELLALNDPTLFALPQRQSFAGQTWLKPVSNSVPPFRWSESPRLLTLPVEQLGSAFMRFMQTNAFTSLTFATKPKPETIPPVVVEIGRASPTNSTVRIAGALEQRRWLNSPVLPSLHAADLVTNTVAQILVKPDGQVFSASLLVPSTVKEADQRALEIARTARFEPLRGPATGLMVGTLIFEWHTAAPLAEPKPTP